MSVALSSSTDKLCVSSYNSTGFGLAAQNYMDTLLLFSDVLCIQEHFLQDCKDKKHSNTNKLRNKFGNQHDMFIVPAAKDSTQVSRGRAKGWLATLWKKSLTKYVSKVKCSNFRLQATKFGLPSGDILVINSYFPCDPRTDNFDDTELVNLLADLRSTIEQSECLNVMIAADLNCHFARYTRFTNHVQDSLQDLNLTILWQNPDGNPDHSIEDVSYTHCSVVNKVAHYSTIDHFATSRRVFDDIIEAGVIHSGENLSNHSAIFIKIKVGNLDLQLEKPSA